MGDVSSWCMWWYKGVGGSWVWGDSKGGYKDRRIVLQEFLTHRLHDQSQKYIWKCKEIITEDKPSLSTDLKTFKHQWHHQKSFFLRITRHRFYIAFHLVSLTDIWNISAQDTINGSAVSLYVFTFFFIRKPLPYCGVHPCQIFCFLYGTPVNCNDSLNDP